VEITMINSTNCTLNGARALYQAGAFAEAEATARTLVTRQPGNLLANTILAACLYKRGRVAEALDRVETALAFHPDDEDILVLRDIFMQTLAAEGWVAQRVCGSAA
jgi:Flp pilus assembly protein TadD